MSNEWWKESVVYQVYPQSFKDSNDDGIGDFNGIKEKLPYLSNLGIDVIWLNPIFESPLIDNGYDISDYKKTLSSYGTIDEFKSLLDAAHNMGIKIILDLVVNHTSDKHEWFLKSKENTDNDYADFYIWKDPKEDGSAPNSWGATFGGPAWEYVESRNQYYLHCFAKEQPDLNWENPKVREHIYDMMKDWFEFGIDGFRMDVISLISKRQDYPEDPSLAYTKSYYAGASNGPRVHEFLHEMNQEVLSKYDILTVGETPNTNSEQAKLYTQPEREELNMVFHFDHMHLDYGKYGKFSDVRFKLSDLKATLSEWQYQLKDGWNSLYWSNHDQPRAVTRFGNDNEYRIESGKMLGSLLHMMKGTPYIFQGEEIGMKNVPFSSIDEYKDIETKYFYQEMKENGESEEYINKAIYLKSRDNARTPMPWDNSKNYGFSDAKPWINYSHDNDIINVKDALEDKNSIFYHYKKLIQLRKEYKVIVHGDYQLINENDSDIYSYTRKYKDETLLVICSFSPYKINYTCPEDVYNDEFKLLLSNYKDSSNQLTQNITLNPYEALIYHIKN
ncbi:glycoside hydrolase family 13 protein [Vagococcus luciliae]|uniref:Oligo-1,6-glucosidase n=1 Tax=Vagococcus luciliae TaxID=2920380 RepID=A0ABY5NZS1_9ENTE|nr:alpha-glucosidase [Vagococcus luciliae]UUV98916.1 Oligo-1,6-glucosidase [Vagococcus luciliae]